MYSSTPTELDPMRHHRRRLTPLTLLATLSLSIVTAPLSACPLCRTDTARATREGIADDVTPRTLLALTLPFALCLGAILYVHRDPPHNHNP